MIRGSSPGTMVRSPQPSMAGGQPGRALGSASPLIGMAGGQPGRALGSASPLIGMTGGQPGRALGSASPLLASASQPGGMVPENNSLAGAISDQPGGMVPENNSLAGAISNQPGGMVPENSPLAGAIFNQPGTIVEHSANYTLNMPLYLYVLNMSSAPPGKMVDSPSPQNLLVAQLDRQPGMQLDEPSRIVPTTDSGPAQMVVPDSPLSADFLAKKVADTKPVVSASKRAKPAPEPASDAKTSLFGGWAVVLGIGGALLLLALGVGAFLALRLSTSPTKERPRVARRR